MDYSELSREKLEEVVEELDRELAETKDELEEIEKTAKKTKADFENYKKKQDERKEKWQKEAQRELSEDLISVIDNLERALLAADEDSMIYQGVKMVSDELMNALEKRGLQRIDAEGEEFDPQIHNAVETQDGEDNKVLEQKKPGYKHHDKVIRPAHVVIGEEKK